MKCEDCGEDKPDTQRRNFWPDEIAKMKRERGCIPALCTECCSKWPGRAWDDLGFT